MKCICPMGGDRTCPDNCLWATWHKLPDDQKTKERRLPIIEQLAKQGYTQDAIAMQLGVSQNTIHHDLETLSMIDNVKGQGKDTRGRKRSTGRPSRRNVQKPKQDAVQAAVDELVQEGKPVNRKKLAEEFGVGEHPVQLATVRAETRKEVLQEKVALDPSHLSKTAQEKLDAAIRAHTRKLDSEFHQAVNARVKEFVDATILPDWRQKIKQAHQLYERRKALMNRDTFNTIRRALHPDSRLSISDQKLGEAFDSFMALEKYLLDEKDSPTLFGDTLPRTYADWEKAKQATTAARRAKRSSSSLRTR